MSDISQVISELRIELGTPDRPASLRRTAEVLNISHTAVSNLESGEQGISIKKINEIIRDLTLGLKAANEIRAILIEPLVVDEKASVS